MKVVIIGAGPSGIVTLKILLEAANRFGCQIEPTLFEAESTIGGTFHYRSYENAELVSSKQLTAFSDFRFPLDHPDHISLPEYVEYLKRYCDQFSLWQYMKFNTPVTSVQRDGEGHLVSYRENLLGDIKVLSCDALAVCSGLHVTPWIPAISGIQNVTKNGGSVMHSSQYKQRSQIANKKVLVLGCGETAMDLVYEAIQAGCPEVILSHRSGWLSIPKVLSDFEVMGMRFTGKLPIDTLITNLFETSYVHPWIAASRLRWYVSDYVLQRVLYILTGTRAGVNQWAGELPNSRLGRAFVFLNKSSKAMPYINRPYKPKNRWMDRLAHYIDPPDATNGRRCIDVAPFVSEVNPDGQVVFSGTERKEGKRMARRIVAPDVVIYATGYVQNLSWLSPEYPRPEEVGIRGIFKSGDNCLAYIGFVRPGIGAIPAISEQQAMFWALSLLSLIPEPKSKPHYRLLAAPEARIQYGVDFGAYMSRLAQDMGSSPSISELLRHGVKVTISYCFGAAFGPYYRLCGPFQTPSASVIAKTELWETITRRGVFGNILFGAIPMLTYGILNALAFVLSNLDARCGSGLDAMITSRNRHNCCEEKENGI